jgi:hypothetical protein
MDKVDVKKIGEQSFKIIAVLFLGMCILFSGGRYQSLGVLDHSSEHIWFGGTLTQYVAKIDVFSGETIISEVKCQKKNYSTGSMKKSYCKIAKVELKQLQ